MHKINWKKIGLAFLAVFGISLGAKAASNVVQNAMRGNAKFNVVAVVMGLIFAGLAFFLVRMDRRVSKLEKEKQNEK